MLFRLVRPVKRSGSSIPYFVQRIPADVRASAVGRVLRIPLGDSTARIRISRQADSIRFSLRTRDPHKAKLRHAAAAAYLETVWHALRQPEPVALTHKQATALAGEMYRGWAEEETERTAAIVWTSDASSSEFVTPDEDEAIFSSAISVLESFGGIRCAGRLGAGVWADYRSTPACQRNR
jgi:hypothetical protein